MGVTKMNKNKSVFICLNHRTEEGMAERITNAFPQVTHVQINGLKCVACNDELNYAERELQEMNTDDGCLEAEYAWLRQAENGYNEDY